MGSTNPLGQRYGSRVVEGVARRGRRNRLHWYMRCDCGSAKWVRRCDVVAGRSSRCLSCAMTKHGHAKGGTTSRLYNIWRGMLHRCTDPKSNRFEHYGGRGIGVHEAWKDDFEAFARDVGEPPTDGHTLDRIDVDGHYEPGNVRWATAAEQNANRRVKPPADADDYDWAADGDPFAEPDDHYDPWENIA